MTYLDMQFEQCYAKYINANIIIFRKQAQLINNLYSCGYEGHGPRIGSRFGNLGETQTCTQTCTPNLAG